MEIIVNSIEDKSYHGLFGAPPVGLTVVYVEFPEHGVKMGLSHRTDDPEGMWLADSRFDNGMPIFCHGEGDRTCNKQIAGPEIVAAIEAAR